MPAAAFDRLYDADYPPAATAHDAWLIARDATEHYQRELNVAAYQSDYMRSAMAKAARDAVDRIALAIRYGGRPFK